jgi:tetratricopeptide (TPR) repeat protein
MCDPARRVRRLLLVSLALMVACAPPRVPLPQVALPAFPDFVQPAIPAALAGTAAAEQERRGWIFLQAGDVKNADRELSAALRAAPDFFPAESALGYVEIARRDGRAALTRFDRVLERHPSDPAALVGRGEANLSLNREADALASFEAAVAADPSLTEVQRRIDVLKFRDAGQGLAEARTAARAGRFDDAIRAYSAAIASSPDSPFLYRELAAVERQKGDAPSALDHLRKAIDLDPSDAGSWTQIGELLEARGDVDGAASAYSSALAAEPSASVQAKLDAVRTRAEIARLPAEYRAIDTTPQVTRGELAALIGVNLGPLLRPDPRREAEPITDVRNDWAATWIMLVARAHILEPFPNHAFQPRAAVRRIDLAQAVSRLLAQIAVLEPAKAKGWETARPKFTDLAPTHLQYPAASAAVASGVLAANPDGSFQPSRAVTGEEASEAVRRLAALARLPSPARATQ